MIVDADADLDEAVPAIVSSAFVYAGQKCSAASRVLVHEAIADALIERVAGATAVLAVGQAAELGTDVPPVIEQSARERVQGYIEQAQRDGRIAAQVQPVPDRGWFCPPTVAADLDPDSPVLSEEVFGPLLAIERVRDVEQACEVVGRAPVRADRRIVRPRSGHRAHASARRRRWATCTSTVGSPARWSGASRSAATACREPERRPAAPTTCSSSSSLGR